MVSRNHALGAFDLAIAKLETARSLHDLEREFLNAAQEYPFRRGAYSWWSHPPPTREPDYKLATPGSHDALAMIAPAGDLWADSRPVITTRLSNDGEESVAVRVALLGPRRRFGVLEASLCVGTDDIDSAERDWRGRFLLLAHVVQHSISLWRSDERPNLGRREIQCLKLAGEGLKAKQIASELGIGQQTVQFHLSRAREKLDCSNTVQAVVRAAQFGLLPDIAPARNPEP